MRTISKIIENYDLNKERKVYEYVSHYKRKEKRYKQLV
ncbi:MAG: hypothetical protein K0S12_1971 [Bacteroidetes bacterium]|jgi:hypothetical protein|nr:hypothetical protein [Bacteroidota bacterium]